MLNLRKYIPEKEEKTKISNIVIDDVEVPNMITLKTNLICRNCGKPLYTSDVEGYPFVCFECDENYYGIEARIPENDHIKLFITIGKKRYEDAKKKIKELSLKNNNPAIRKIDDISYDEISKEMILSLSRIPSEKDISQYKALAGIE